MQLTHSCIHICANEHGQPDCSLLFKIASPLAQCLTQAVLPQMVSLQLTFNSHLFFPVPHIQNVRVPFILKAYY